MNRKQTSKRISRETAVGAGVLMMLVIVAASVFHRQYRFNPAVNITPTVMDTRHSDDMQSPDILPPDLGVETASPSAVFTEENLYEKIDGRAELYLSAGFKRLLAQRYRFGGEGEKGWFEIFVYHMRSPQDAFAVYSAQKREEATSSDVARHAYRTENALFFVHGDRYVEMIAAGASKNYITTMANAAEAFISQHPIEAPGAAPGMEWFPEKGADADSFSVIAENAFGYDRLDQVYTLQYRMGEETLTAFVSKRESATAATDIAGGFVQMLVEFGGRERETAGSEKMNIIEIMDTFEVVLTVGPFVAGVHEATNGTAAEALAGRLREKLREVDESG